MNFYKKFDSYDKNAVVQKKAAEKLVKMIKEHFENFHFKTVFEIGCGTGIFTRLFLKDFKAERIILNDIFNTERYLKNIDYDKFIISDMDKTEFPFSEIIISSSVFQWSKDFESLVKNISISSENLAFSIYLEGNLIEIKNHFDISLKYFTESEIEKILKKYFKNVKKECAVFTENFSSPMEALRHLSSTGVTGFEKTEIKKIRSFSSKKLTYKTGYFLCSKN